MINKKSEKCAVMIFKRLTIQWLFITEVLLLFLSGYSPVQFI